MALVAPLIVVTTPARAQQAPGSENYSSDEIVRAGSNFFGEVSGGLASVVEHAVAQYGLPNGYILGQQGSGAIIAGVRYGDGTLYTKNAGQHAVFFQGPSIGWDFGGDGSRVMMLVYNLPSVSAIYDRFVGINGSAYLVAGFGMTVLSRNNVYVVPIVSGVGARLGFNVGYLKFTDRRTWNPF
ncbi:DUF1134 domain-containing protein [Kaistia dalseonensis]|nr:DUF1134 domain-containing protein [Kaistia dalseonensis]MCX5496414.1 DUF1134 domain-containing protein [Kaistia dalseonensis]